MDNSQLVSSVLLQTNPELYYQINGGNSWRASISQRGARVKLYRRYEKGDHRADITDQMRKMLRLNTDDANLSDFCDNYTRLIIDKMAGRLHAQGISTNDTGIDENWLADMLAAQSFDAAQGMWWRGAIRDGESYVMVDPDTLLWTSEPAFDQFAGMVVIYDQLTRRAVWACKLWSETDPEDINDDSPGLVSVMRIVAYQPARVSYWKGTDGGQAAEVDSTKTARPWPAELGGRLPIIAYANQRDSYTMYGESEIRPAVPLQDVLNRTVYSMVMASEFAAFPVNISVGMEVTPGGIVPGGIVNLILRDESGNAISNFTSEQLQFLQAARVTQLQAADLSQYTNQIDRVVKEISQCTQTPIYGVTTSGAISGDALKQLEIGLIGKVQRFQRQNTDALKALIILTADMQRIFKPGAGAPQIDTVLIDWKSAELLDANASIAALVQMRKDASGLWPDKFYRSRIGAILGMKRDEIEAAGQVAIDEKDAENERLIEAANAQAEASAARLAEQGQTAPAPAQETPAQAETPAPVPPGLNNG